MTDARDGTPEALNAWLGSGDAPEADWGAYILKLAMRGGLGHGGPGLLLDLEALAQPFACTPQLCTPGQRPAGTRSCCADIEVSTTPWEKQAIEGALPEIRSFMTSRDPRWHEAAPKPFEGDAFTRPGGRCVFSWKEGGLRCGLHALEDATGRARGALKPMPCRLFPLIVIDLGGRVLLTAVAKGTARKSGLPPAKSFPCLGAAGPEGLEVLVTSVRDTLREIWGDARYRQIRREVSRWLLSQAPRQQ